MIALSLLIAKFATFLAEINIFFLQQGDDDFHGYNPICVILSIVGLPIIGLIFIISLLLSLIINIMIWMLRVYLAILMMIYPK